MNNAKAANAATAPLIMVALSVASSEAVYAIRAMETE
jgi:hypothetical protein